MTRGSKSPDCEVLRLDLFKKVCTICRIPACFEVFRLSRGCQCCSVLSTQCNTLNWWKISGDRCGLHKETVVTYGQCCKLSLFGHRIGTQSKLLSRCKFTRLLPINRWWARIPSKVQCFPFRLQKPRNLLHVSYSDCNLAHGEREIKLKV